MRSSLRTGKGLLTKGGLALAGRSLLAPAIPYFLGRCMDLVALRAPAADLYGALTLMMAFALSTAFCQFWMRWSIIRWSRDAELVTRDDLFAHLMRLPAPFFDRSQTGDLMSRLTSDIEAVRMGYGPGLMHFIQPGLMTFSALLLMSLESWSLTLVTCIPMALLFVIMRALLPRIHERSLRVQEQQARVSARAQESFSGARVIKAFAREDYEENRFAELSRRLLDDSFALAKTRALFTCLIEAMSGLAVVTVLLVGGSHVIEGSLTLGSYAAFNGYMQMLIWPMIALGWTLSLFTRAEASSLRLAELRDVAPVEAGTASGQVLALGSIQFRDLTFSYVPEKPPALSNVTIHLKAGSTLGVVGPTGSGKSTLAHLLLRLHEPPRGTLFLDAKDVLDWDLDALRRSMALVPQEAFLFSRSIRENIGFGHDDPNQASVERAAHLASLDDDVLAFPEGLDTEVGERGVTLSGGQRQRVAIARALVMEAPVLVLDDALSAVDTETEQRIIRHLEPVMAQRSTIIISHRLSAVVGADEIVVLDQGRICERGTHEELLGQVGEYSRLWHLQQEEQELEHL